MQRSMPKSRQHIRKEEAVAAQLRKAIRAAGITGIRKQREAINRAASGRPSDLAEKARASLQERRVKRDLDMIAGRA